MNKEELFDLFKKREKARAYYERMSMSEKDQKSIMILNRVLYGRQAVCQGFEPWDKLQFEAEFRCAQAKREYETLSRQYQLALDKHLNGE